eukprot:132645-Pyramimonas_sp.AAC.1
MPCSKRHNGVVPETLADTNSSCNFVDLRGGLMMRNMVQVRAADWSVVRVCLRFLRPIGPP